MRAVSSAVGPVNAGAMGAVAALLIQKVALPLVNNATARGFPLPSLSGLKLTNVDLQLASRVVQIAADFTYAQPAALSVPF